MKRPDKKACEMSVKELAAYIDYSVLKPEFTEQEIIDLTKDGVALGCATICINPGYMDLCEPEVSPFNKNFDKTFLKRVRAYDNNGKEFDIEMVFKMLENTRYISDGNKDTIVINSNNESKINSSINKEIIIY